MSENYQIVDAANTPGLEAKVQKLLKKGWSLQGGVSAISIPISGIPANYHFYQAMSKGIIFLSVG